MNNYASTRWNQLNRWDGLWLGTDLTRAEAFFYRRDGKAEGIGPFMVLYPKTRGQAVQKNFLKSLKIGDLPAGTPLWRARLAQFMGDFERAQEESEQILDSRWKLFVHSVGAFAQLTNLERTLKKWDALGKCEANPVLLELTVRLRLAVGDPRAKDDIETLRAMVPPTDPSAPIWNARVARFRAQLQGSGAIEILSHARNELKQSMNLSAPRNLESLSYVHFLALETLRRIEDHLVFAYSKLARHEEARHILDHSVDLHCERLQFMVAENARSIGDSERARHFYFKAYRGGTLYGDCVAKRLSSTWEPSFGIAWEDRSSKAAEGSMVEILSVASNETSTVSDPIKSHRLFPAFSPYFDLAPPRGPAPLHSQTALLPWIALKNNASPWYETVVGQRALPPPFRDELFLFFLGPQGLGPETTREMSSLERLGSSSDEGRQVLSLYDNYSDLSFVQRAYLSRLLGALGFYHEALEVAEIGDLSHPAPEKLYLAATHSFLRSFASRDPEADQLATIRSLFESAPDQPESLRIRLVLSMNASVMAGQSRNLSECKTWRERALRTLNTIENCDLFSEFEKGLLKSRTYRAVSYAPFLERDLKTLFSDQVHCEKNARDLSPITDREKLLARENLFPMLESSARMFEAGGNLELALRYMGEIVDQVDPHDSKAWIQVGELSKRLGRFDKALHAFMTAARWGVPMARIAWFLAGNEFARRGDKAEAIHCFHESLLSWPDGKAPLEHIARLSGDIDPPLFAWALSALGQHRGQ